MAHSGSLRRGPLHTGNRDSISRGHNALARRVALLERADTARPEKDVPEPSWGPERPGLHGTGQASPRPWTSTQGGWKRVPPEAPGGGGSSRPPQHLGPSRPSSPGHRWLPHRCSQVPHAGRGAGWCSAHGALRPPGPGQAREESVGAPAGSAPHSRGFCKTTGGEPTWGVCWGPDPTFAMAHLAPVAACPGPQRRCWLPPWRAASPCTRMGRDEGHRGGSLSVTPHQSTR